jgi:CspA family cold shock protein
MLQWSAQSDLAVGCAFRDVEIQDWTRQTRLVAWPARSVAASFLCLARRRVMAHKGTVKWFNPTKGYGFIKPNGGDKDVFVHISAVERAGLSTLNENQVVEYDLVENRGKQSAENLKVS